jgi:hypothetical protein
MPNEAFLNFYVMNMRARAWAVRLRPRAQQNHATPVPLFIKNI